MSSIAFATRASRLPSSSGRGGRRQRPLAERGAGGAERPGDDDEVAGPRAGPARHALRAAERGDAEHDAPALVVSPPSTGTPARRCPRTARPRRRAGLRRQPSVTTSASGSAPEAARSLMLTAAARKPSSRQSSRSKRKWTPSTSASCVTTRPSISAASCSIPDEPAPLELGEQPELADLAERRHSSLDPRPPVERLGVERCQRVVEPRVERPRAAGAGGGVLGGDAERGERLGRRVERLVRLRGEEAAGERGRDAAGPVTAASSGCRSRRRATRSPSRDVVDRAGDRGDERRAAAPAARASSAGSSPVAIDSTPRTSASAPTSVATSPGLPRSTATSTSSRIRRAVSVRYAVAPAPTGSSTTGIPRAFAARAGEQHRLDPLLRERADVEHERGREPDHLLDLLAARAPSPAAHRARESRSPSRS